MGLGFLSLRAILMLLLERDIPSPEHLSLAEEQAWIPESLHQEEQSSLEKLPLHWT